MTDELKTLPIVKDDGFNLPTDRVIIGERLKWTSEGGWIAWGQPFDAKRRLLAIGCNDFLQMWHEQRVVEMITDKPFPDLEELNAKIPEKDWEKDFTGKPKAPWVHTWAAYFLDPTSGDRFTYLNSTYGAMQAVRNLKDRVDGSRMLRGPHAVPVVTLGDKPMPTRFGMKSRPDFEIVDWVLLGGDKAPGLQPAPMLAIAKAPTPASKDVFDDELPW